ncbi:MAG: right-handed parallel beta-helix repeat-containing protein [Candidatus Micrarchaeota archaeon]
MNRVPFVLIAFAVLALSSMTVALTPSEQAEATRVNTLISNANARMAHAPKPTRLTDPVEPAVGKVGYRLGNPPREATTTCTHLTQADFDAAAAAGGNLVLSFSAPDSCYKLNSNIQFDYTLVVNGGDSGFSTYFSCENYYLTKKTSIGNTHDGIRVEGTQTVKNCIVTGHSSRYGFFLPYATAGRVVSSSAIGNSDGFFVYGGSVSSSTASGNTWTGFVVRGGSGSVSSSTASSNSFGFEIYDGGTVSGSTASGNYLDGFLVGGGSVSGSTALGNTFDGYYVYNTGSVSGSIASGNSIGFDIGGGTVSSSTASGNGDYGFIVSSSIARDIVSNSNGNGIYVGSGPGTNARLEVGRRVCGNTGAYGIFVNGGTVTGTYATDKPIAGGGDWSQATFTPCIITPPYTPPGTGGSPILISNLIKYSSDSGLLVLAQSSTDAAYRAVDEAQAEGVAEAVSLRQELNNAGADPLEQLTVAGRVKAAANRLKADAVNNKYFMLAAVAVICVGVAWFFLKKNRSRPVEHHAKARHMRRR